MWYTMCAYCYECLLTRGRFTESLNLSKQPIPSRWWSIRNQDERREAIAVPAVPLAGDASDVRDESPLRAWDQREPNAKNEKILLEEIARNAKDASDEYYRTRPLVDIRGHRWPNTEDMIDDLDLVPDVDFHPYHCPSCKDYTIGTRESFKAHHRRYHGSEISFPPYTPAKPITMDLYPFVCRLCDEDARKFADRIGLKNHIYTMHAI